MRVGACQTPEILGDVDAAVRVVQKFASMADTAGVDLLLFPECFLQGRARRPERRAVGGAGARENAVV